MLDLNFASEFARRAELLFNDESKYEEVMDEYRSLDPREANILYQSFNYEPGTVEHVHATTRIAALVASGGISEDLATLANMENIPSENNVPMSYQYSRLTLEEALDKYSTGTSNPLDPDGNLVRMINRGDTKSRIVGKLLRNTFYNSQLDLLDAKDLVSPDNIAAMVSILKFEDFVEALDNLEDLPYTPDFKKLAKVAISEYDPKGVAAAAIDKGANSAEVFTALEYNPVWVDAAKDFMTKDDVEQPTSSQSSRWGKFLTVVNTVKNIDNF